MAVCTTRGSPRSLRPTRWFLIATKGQLYDIDFNSVQEGKKSDQATYAAITSRSYHAGGSVNLLRLDGSTTSLSDQIDLRVWRAVSTIAGYETLGDKSPF